MAGGDHLFPVEFFHEKTAELGGTIVETASERGSTGITSFRVDQGERRDLCIIDSGFDFDLIACNIQSVTVTKALQIEVDYLRHHKPLFMCASLIMLLGSYYCRRYNIRGGVACYAHSTIKFDVLDVCRHFVELDIEKYAGLHGGFTTD